MNLLYVKPEQMSWMCSIRKHTDRGNPFPLPSEYTMLILVAPATSSFASWMTHHPALRWVGGYRKQTKEAHLLDKKLDVTLQSRIVRGDKYAVAAPEANETDLVVDCEWKHYLACYVLGGMACGDWRFSWCSVL